MNLTLCSLASGSSGNCYLIKSNTTAILVDAGISAKKTCERLAACGIEITDIAGILLTHEHSDHTQGIPVLIKKENINLFVNRKTFEASGLSVETSRLRCFVTGEAFSVGDINVQTFHNSHDAADPTGFKFECEGSTIVIVTDTGYVTDEAMAHMKDSNILVLESNHDENVLKMGRYPWFLKQRILGEKGHLSNDAAAEALLNIIRGAEEIKLKTVLLAHLSAENNFPEMALTTVNNILEAECPMESSKIKVAVLPRMEQSPLYTI